MSVRKRTWFTQSEIRKIDPRARALARPDADGKTDADCKKNALTYRQAIATELGIKPRESFVVAYSDKDGPHIETFEKKRDADAYHDKVSSDVRQGNTAPSKSISVTEAADNWINRVEADARERSTLDQYRQHVRLHITPRHGRVKLAELTPKQIETFRDDLLATVSRPLARKVLTSLKSILKVANYSQVAAHVTIGHDKRGKRKLEVGVDIPTPAEVRRLIAATEDPRRRALLLTVALTGLRASELRGLRWSDVDLKACELTVRQRASRYCEIGHQNQ